MGNMMVNSGNAEGEPAASISLYDAHALGLR